MSDEVNENEQQKTTVVNLHRAEYDVYIGRKGKGQDGYFGNPIDMRNFSRKECIERYTEYFYNRITVDHAFRDRVQKLVGKRLGCFCKPQACHGDVIVEYLEKLQAMQVAEPKRESKFDSEIREMANHVSEADLPEDIQKKIPEVQMLDGIILNGERFKAWYNDNKAFLMTRICAQRTCPTETIETPMMTEMDRDHRIYEAKRRSILASMEG